MSHHYPEGDATCGPAALRTLLEQAGHPAPAEATLADALETDLHGTRPERFERYLAAQNIAYKAWHGDLGMGDVTDLLEQHAVMVGYQSKVLNVGHFAVVASVGDEVELEGPWFGPGTCLAASEFLEAWRSEPHEQEARPRWCLAIEGQP